MVYFSGDTHGDIDVQKLFRLSSERSLTRDDIIIILGDCGVVFYKPGEKLKRMIELYESIGATILYIDGNHENFPLIETYPVTEIFGAKANRISDHVYRIRRGEVLTLDGVTMLCIGGAMSHDKEWRVEGESWWKEEDITDADVDNALENVSKLGGKVDLILTHCIDSPTQFAGLHFKPDKSSNCLSRIDYEVKYTAWLCGHYHIDRFLGFKKVCLYEKIAYLDKSSDSFFSFIEEEQQ